MTTAQLLYFLLYDFTLFFKTMDNGVCEKVEVWQQIDHGLL